VTSIKSGILLFVGSALSGALFASVGEAAALSRRQHSSACAHMAVATRIDYYGGTARGTGSPEFLICPAIDDSYLPKGSLTTLNIHVLDDNVSSSVTAKACSYYWAGNGGACGGQDTSGNAFVGHDTLTPALTYWGPAYAADFGYFTVEIPGYDTSRNPGYSMYRGAYFAN
jgi:hypothetical protein